MKRKSVKLLTIQEVKRDHPIVKKKIEKSLEISVKEAKVSAVANGVGTSYFGPFALFLGANSSQMSLLHGIASLLPSLTQLYSSHLIEKHPRKKITVASAALTVLFFGLIAALGVLYFFDYGNIWALLVLIALFYIAFGLGYPAWFSWMGSLIPAQERGKYLSKRIRVASIAGLITMLISALALDYLKKIGTQQGQELIFTAIGFVALFSLACIFKLFSTRYLFKQYEPRIRIRKKDRDGLFNFIKNSGKSALGKFSWFSFAFRIAIGVSAPFYVIFILRDFQFSYFTYMVFLVMGMLFQIVFLPVMGKVSDRFGNVALVKTCSLALTIVPILTFISIYIPNKNLMALYILIVPQIFSGFGWAGLNLATSNYLYDSTTPQKRGYALTNMNLLIGVGMFVGTLIASTLSSLNISFLSVSLFAFALSSILRLAVVIIGKCALEEVREVAPFSPTYFLHEIHPLRGTIGQIQNMNHRGAKIIHHI